METAHIPLKLINQMMEQVQNAPCKEICGLISSHNGLAANCYPVTNADTQPNHRFLMEPKQQIDSLRLMREQNEELYAIYHSHPNTPAMPSAEDLKQAAYPGVLHIIISMSTTGTLQMRGFRFKGNSTTSVDIIVE